MSIKVRVVVVATFKDMVRFISFIYFFAVVTITYVNVIGGIII